VPDLPENFVPRSAELEALKQSILSDRDRRHVALVALKGMGASVRRCSRRRFVTTNPFRLRSDLINQMRETAKALDKSTEGFDTLVGNSNLLRNLLKEKSVLLVLDDVWNAKHVSYFQTQGARFCRLLLTTRDALRVWDLKDGKEILTLTVDAAVTACIAAPDNRTIVAGDSFGRLHFLRLIEPDKTESPISGTKTPLLLRQQQSI
jgi:hypothetical protein